MADENELPEGESETVVAPETEAPEPEEQDPYAPLAQKMGWVPKDDFKGDPEGWKPAEQFILDGREIQAKSARELREVNAKIDHMARTNAAILEEQLNREREKLFTQHQAAVEDGDPQKAWEISQRINKVEQRVPQGPPPESADWVQRNQWFMSDPVAQARAQEVAQLYANQGKGVGEQLAAAEQVIRREYPHHFPQARQAREVSAPGGRSAAPSNREKGAADMPRENQSIAKDMVERGVIPNVEAYSRNYWATEGKNR